MTDEELSKALEVEAERDQLRIKVSGLEATNADQLGLLRQCLERLDCWQLTEDIRHAIKQAAR